MLINDADRWRRRAEEARALAGKLNGEQARAAMLGVADDYEKLARRAERRSYLSGIPSDNLNDSNYGLLPVSWTPG